MPDADEQPETVAETVLEDDRDELTDMVCVPEVQILGDIVEERDADMDGEMVPVTLPLTLGQEDTETLEE